MQREVIMVRAVLAALLLILNPALVAAEAERGTGLY